MYMYCSHTNNYTYYTIRSHYKHLCKLQLRMVIRRSSLLHIVLHVGCMYCKLHTCDFILIYIDYYIKYMS